MGVCAQCQLIEVPAGARSCPGCGAAQLASFEVPDLDLPVASTPAPAPQKKSKPRQAPAKLELGVEAPAAAKAAPPPAFQSAPGIDDDDPVGPSLELAVSPAQAPVPRTPAARAPAPSSPERAGRTSVPPPPRRQAASLPEADAIDSYELRQVARFGPVPAHPWESVLYAIRVGRRVVALREEIAQAESEQKKLAKALEDALVAFLDKARGSLSQDAAMARIFEPVREAQARYDERLRVIEELDAQGQRELSEIDQQITTAERAAQEGRSTHEGLTSEAARLFDASRSGDPLATQLLDAIRGQMSISAEDATQAISRMTELRRRRREVEQTYVARLRDLEEALHEADQPRRVGLIEVGQDLLEHNTKIEHEAFAPVEVARKRLQEHDHRRRLLNAATTAYDRSKVIEGILVLVGAVVLVVGSFVVGVLRMNRELNAPPPVLPPM